MCYTVGSAPPLPSLPPIPFLSFSQQNNFSKRTKKIEKGIRGLVREAAKKVIFLVVGTEKITFLKLPLYVQLFSGI